MLETQALVLTPEEQNGVAKFFAAAAPPCGQILAALGSCQPAASAVASPCAGLGGIIAALPAILQLLQQAAAICQQINPPAGSGTTGT